MLTLDGLKLAKRAIVLRVGQGGPVADVVVVRGLMQQRAKLLGAPFDIHGSHARALLSRVLLPRTPAWRQSRVGRAPRPRRSAAAFRPMCARRQGRSDRGGDA